MPDLPDGAIARRLVRPIFGGSCSLCGEPVMASSDRRYWGFAVASSATGWVHYRCADQIKDIADSIRNARVIHLTNGQKLEHP